MRNNNLKFIFRAIFGFYLIVGLAGIVLFVVLGNANENTEIDTIVDINAEPVEENIIARTDELENVASVIESAMNTEEVTTDEVDEDGVGFVEVETKEEPPEDVEVHTEVSGDFVGEALVNVKGGFGLNLRTGPGMEYKVIIDYKNGTVMSIIDGDGTEEWIHVTDGRNEGYMYGNHLSVTMY